ncbi:MAG: hypothetical protein ACJAQT_000222 [Akkermansiaceae bacterium]|jgi:hypothetical protein
MSFLRLRESRRVKGRKKAEARKAHQNVEADFKALENKIKHRPQS